MRGYSICTTHYSVTNRSCTLSCCCRNDPIVMIWVAFSSTGCIVDLEGKGEEKLSGTGSISLFCNNRDVNFRDIGIARIPKSTLKLGT